MELLILGTILALLAFLKINNIGYITFNCEDCGLEVKKGVRLRYSDYHVKDLCEDCAKNLGVEVNYRRSND